MTALPQPRGAAAARRLRCDGAQEHAGPERRRVRPLRPAVQATARGAPPSPAVASRLLADLSAPRVRTASPDEAIAPPSLAEPSRLWRPAAGGGRAGDGRGRRGPDAAPAGALPRVRGAARAAQARSDGARTAGRRPGATAGLDGLSRRMLHSTSSIARQETAGPRGSSSPFRRAHAPAFVPGLPPPPRDGVGSGDPSRDADSSPRKRLRCVQHAASAGRSASADAVHRERGQPSSFELRSRIGCRPASASRRRRLARRWPPDGARGRRSRRRPRGSRSSGSLARPDAAAVRPAPGRDPRASCATSGVARVRARAGRRSAACRCRSCCCRRSSLTIPARREFPSGVDLDAPFELPARIREIHVDERPGGRHPALGGVPGPARGGAAADRSRPALALVRAEGRRAATRRRPERAGIRTIEDLLYRFPFATKTAGASAPSAHLAAGDDRVPLSGRIARCGLRPTRRPGFTLFEAVVRDESGTIIAVWFNQRFLRDVFQPGQRVALYGTVERADTAACRSSTRITNCSMATRARMPVAGAAHGPHRAGLRADRQPDAARAADARVRRRSSTLPDDLPDRLPAEIAARHGWPPLARRCGTAHFPAEDGTDLDALNACRSPAQVRLSSRSSSCSSSGWRCERRRRARLRKPFRVRVDDACPGRRARGAAVHADARAAAGRWRRSSTTCSGRAR